jgi:hypothetical protein
MTAAQSNRLDTLNDRTWLRISIIFSPFILLERNRSISALWPRLDQIISESIEMSTLTINCNQIQPCQIVAERLRELGGQIRSGRADIHQRIASLLAHRLDAVADDDGPAPS